MVDESNFISMFLDEAEEHIETWAQCSQELKLKFDLDWYNKLFRAAHSLKGGSKSVGLKKFGEFVHKVEDCIQVIGKDQKNLSDKQSDLLLSVENVLSDWVEELRNDHSYVPEETHDILKTVNSLLNLPANETKDFATQESKTPTGLQLFDDEPDTSASNDQNTSIDTNNEPPPDSSHKLSNKPTHSKNDLGTARIEKIKLIEAANLGRQLSIQKEIIKRSFETNQANSEWTKTVFENLYQNLGSLTESINSFQLSPIQPLLKRLVRSGQTTANKLNKQVDFVIEGESTQVDKSIQEKIKDPLMHILNNAVDHGLESTEERLKKGKKERSLVKLVVEPKNENIEIKIKDDGGGIDKSKILQKAIQKGLVSEGDKNLQDNEIFGLIMKPGFSTAEKLTEVSGRGVGLDVVNGTVKELKGIIEISSELNIGTEFHITLPLSVSSLDCIIIDIKGVQFCVAMSSIYEIVDLRNVKLSKTKKKNYRFLYKDKMIGLFKLSDYLKVSNSCHQDNLSKKSIQPALITKFRDKYLALECDHIIFQQEIVLEARSDKLGHANYYSGTTILNNGQPSIVLNLENIVHSIVST